MCNIIEILELNVQYYKNMGHIKLFVMHTFVKLELKSITYYQFSNISKTRQVILLAQSKLLCHKKVKASNNIHDTSLGEEASLSHSMIGQTPFLVYTGQTSAVVKGPSHVANGIAISTNNITYCGAFYSYSKTVPEKSHNRIVFPLCNWVVKKNI